MGVAVEKHHHEVGSAQHELGIKFQTLVKACDSLQIYKYCIHQTAQAYGKTVTFMPKPVFGDNGSGMHVHQSIWKEGKPVFAGNRYADLSEECLFYIGGILEARQGAERADQPVDELLQAPGARLRGAGAASPIRRATARPLPASPTRTPPRPSAWRSARPRRQSVSRLHGDADGRPRRHQEPDPSGDPMDKETLRPAAEELKEIPTVCGSLREAIASLDADRDFLKAGGVFDDDQIDSYLELKAAENIRFEMMPHPVEFDALFGLVGRSPRRRPPPPPLPHVAERPGCPPVRAASPAAGHAGAAPPLDPNRPRGFSLRKPGGSAGRGSRPDGAPPLRPATTSRFFSSLKNPASPE